MIRPYGTWESPISAAMVATQGLRLGAVSIDGDDIYWLEGRPSDGGRTVLVRRTPEGLIHDVTAAPFNVRTRVHEYGGGAYAVSDGVVYFSNFSDQRLYRVSSRDGRPPVAVTPPGAWRFADGVIDRRRQRLFCVREDHSGGGTEPVNMLVSIALEAAEPGEGTVIVSGHDFYSTPRVSPDGRRLSWICWRHPNMPWDGTELWVADLADDGSIARPMRVAGGHAESIYQAGWLPDGSLCFASDRDDWWRLYRSGADADGPPVTVTPLLAQPPDRTEFGRPEWVFGTSTWVSATADRLVTTFTRDGRWQLGTIDIVAGTLQEIVIDVEPLDWLTATETHALMVAASPSQAEAVVRIDLSTGRLDVIRTSSSPVDQDGQSRHASIDRSFISVPQAIEFPTGGDGKARAFYYPPRNGSHSASSGERPPLLVMSHGGPTTATRDTLDLRVQFWTSRGFAVADVNYRGSSGYGRDYRRLLNGQWGIADVEDCINVARWLVDQGKADSQRLMIRGGSAGGYTTLAALTFHPDVFKAGASYYGICDLEVLARDTHKFESRYLDSMIGPYPASREIYRSRSPIHFVDRLSCALILFQGLEDKVVPPNQSEMMADAVRAKGLPVAYLTFAGEQHGFRKAETIVRCQEAELFFYGAVFGFPIADVVTPPAIDNLQATRRTEEGHN